MQGVAERNCQPQWKILGMQCFGQCDRWNFTPEQRKRERERGSVRESMWSEHGLKQTIHPVYKKNITSALKWVGPDSTWFDTAMRYQLQEDLKVSTIVWMPLMLAFNTFSTVKGCDQPLVGSYKRQMFSEKMLSKLRKPQNLAFTHLKPILLLKLTPCQKRVLDYRCRVRHSRPIILALDWFIWIIKPPANDAWHNMNVNGQRETRAWVFQPNSRSSCEMA